VSDVTDTRIAEKRNDDLLQEKAVLLQELQHRVANSLQIIASVLMQIARNTQSEETRTHLHDAHKHVMSVTAVQKQLAASSISDVELRPYFAALCRSIPRRRLPSLVRRRLRGKRTIASPLSIKYFSSAWRHGPK